MKDPPAYIDDDATIPRHLFQEIQDTSNPRHFQSKMADSQIKDSRLSVLDPTPKPQDHWLRFWLTNTTAPKPHDHWIRFCLTNHTRDDEIFTINKATTIFVALEEAYVKFPTWLRTDDIRISGTCDYCS